MRNLNIGVVSVLNLR
ncbi:MAG: hypothetical protein ACKVS6_11970 [Planctomycetota bacterium]